MTPEKLSLNVVWLLNDNLDDALKHDTVITL